MIQLNSSPLIGPKPIFMQPLESYQNHDIDDTQCTDDFNNQFLSQANNSLQETPYNKNGMSNQRKDEKKKVKFNLNIVHCQFNQKEPAIAIGKLVQKLINQKPYLEWVNPQISKIQ
ncbi:unnamed protein product (macronuclear) [Paramecium tetraurelia]|uniref:Uncharacterized protein n=1 Tax=Paramecium tetraurelia TaxID=5888 RepID=A0D4T6_PARTE|nr:uncharacterized protein GSPATT00013500001 [Paramecium tetraurelia]CAK78053.1 unnamed protein product [Paramecium tetraurelia]|eukprot:XP_001445450.1 hypothetical protein (macronuclear) [Paramecium tetraurelia strain d4-2]